MFKRMLSGVLSFAIAFSLVTVTLPQIMNAPEAAPILTASAASAVPSTLIAKGDTWHYIRTTEDSDPTDASWNNENFDTNEAWTEAATPIGYGYSSSNNASLATKLEQGDGVFHLYLQKKMQVDSLEGFDSLLLNIDADDTAKVYVNGTLVYSKLSDPDVDKDVKEIYPRKLRGGSSGNVRVSAESLKVGTNIVSVDVKNVKLTSSDLYFDMSLALVPENSIAKGDTWHYVRTTEDGDPTDASWNNENFDTNDAWTEAITPVGYGYSSADGNAPLATKLDQGDGIMHLYLQKKLQVDSLYGVNSLLLNIEADDTAKIYVNGTLVYSKEVATDVGKDLKDIYPGNPRGGSSGDVHVPADSLKVGTNIISVDVKNATLTSSDLYFDMSLALSDAMPAATSITKGSTWHYIRTTENVDPTDASWNNENFDENAAWVEAKAPIGYGYSASNNAPLGTDIGKGDGILHMFVQKKLQIDNLDGVKSLLLNIDADDSANVYVNGTLVYSKVSSPDVDKGIKDIYPDNPRGGSSGNVYVSAEALKVGTNIIGVDVKNVQLSSSDLYFDMSLALSEEELPYEYSELMLTPGADETGLRFAWYTNSLGASLSTNYIDAAYNDSKYVVSHGADDGAFYFNDNNTKTIYKIPLDATKSGGKVGLDVAANYTIELSADGTTYTQVAAAPNGAGVAEMGKDNRKIEAFDIDTYAAGQDFIWARIGDQTTANGWGGCIYRIYVSYTDNDGDGEVDFESKGVLDPKVQIVKKSELVDGEMPESTEANTFVGYASAAITGKATNKVEVSVEPNTEYAYRISANSADKWSDIYYTTTRGGEDGFSFIYVSDPQLASGEGLTKDTEKWVKNLELAEAKAAETNGASFILSSGDQVDSGSNEAQFAGLASPTQMQSIPFVPTVGNHDTGSPNLSYHFNTPNNTGLAKTPAGSNYYFSYGDTLFIILNGNNTNFAEHEATLAAAVESHPDARWIIASMHQDIYGSGKQHSMKESIYNLRMGMYPLYEKYGVDVVLSGHDHTYTRSYIMKENVPVKDPAADANGTTVDPDGILYMTANTASGKYYPLSPVKGYYADFRSQYNTPSYSIIDISDNEFTINTYRTDTNAVYDSYSMRKSVTTEELQAVVAEAKQAENTCITRDELVREAEEALDGGSLTEERCTDLYKEIYELLPRAVIHDGANVDEITFAGVSGTITEYNAYSAGNDNQVYNPSKTYNYDGSKIILDGALATTGKITASVPYETDLKALAEEIKNPLTEDELAAGVLPQFTLRLTNESQGATVEHKNVSATASRLTETLVITSERGNYSLSYAVTVTRKAAKNGWQKDENGVEHYYKDNIMQSNVEVLYGGVYYYVNADGTKLVNAFAPNGNYYGADGKRMSGKITVNGAEYILDANGAPVKGFIDDGGNRYYADATGKLVKNAQVAIGGATYRFNAAGVLYRNAMVTVSGAKYYYGADGKMLTSKIVSYGGKSYYVDATGKVVSKKWITVSKKTYYAGADGALYKNAVKKIGGKSYVFNASGVLQKGSKLKLVTVKKKSYIVNKSGVVQKGKKNKLVKVGKKSYIVDKNGVVQKGKNKLVKIGKKTYIVNKKGVVYKSKTVKIGKVSYKINKKGVATKRK